VESRDGGGPATPQNPLRINASPCGGRFRPAFAGLTETNFSRIRTLAAGPRDLPDHGFSGTDNPMPDDSSRSTEPLTAVRVVCA
jgi:hypothetical protein